MTKIKNKKTAQGKKEKQGDYAESTRTGTRIAEKPGLTVIPVT